MARTSKKFDFYCSEEGIAKIRSWTEKGLTQKQMAENIGIGLRTFIMWLEKCPEMREAYEGGVESQEKQLYNALFRKALGYKDMEVQVERYKLNGEVIENDPRFPIKEKIITKTFPPDVGAIAFILKCRFGWKEKSVIEVDDNRDNPMSGLTTEELRKLANACE